MTLQECNDILKEWVDQISNFQTYYGELLSNYARVYAGEQQLSPEKVRFIIFIDELDRCMPEKSVAILENIKNFLSIDNVAYVLSINPEIIAQT